MINARAPMLYIYVASMRDAGTDPASCFDRQIRFDRDDPKGEKAAAADVAAKKSDDAAKKKKDAAGGLDDFLSAVLSKGPKKKFSKECVESVR